MDWELQATRATRYSALQFMPCDVFAFLDHLSTCEQDVSRLIMLFLLQQPASHQAWASTGVMGRLRGVEATEFHRSLLAVAAALHEDTPITEFKQMSGASPLMGRSTVLGALHIVDNRFG